MAGQREPLNLLLIKGKKHLTKEEIKTRLESEVKAKDDNVKPPSYLPKKLKTEFEEIANELMRIEIMSNLDVDALARFLLAREQYVRVNKSLRSMPVMVDAETKSGETIKIPNESYGELLISQDKLFKQCRQAAADLGLTISSRCRLVVPKKSEEKPKTAEEKMFGDVL
ncbi:terminase [Paenibacillus ihbetae]|uniref:Terminase n=1 Tax=Paenibacillus ihbetae TaxID=1870820 RepID=A0A1B2DVC3_9BACL|nr:phage terminase small subunit P27 family [Paenibacillus ihbetae]ANY71666.1 terminase [Paenibacillus ihbetae]